MKYGSFSEDGFDFEAWLPASADAPLSFVLIARREAQEVARHEVPLQHEPARVKEIAEALEGFQWQDELGWERTR